MELYFIVNDGYKWLVLTNTQYPKPAIKQKSSMIGSNFPLAILILQHSLIIFHCSMKIYIFRVRIHIFYVCLIPFGKILQVKLCVKRKMVSSGLTKLLGHFTQYDQPIHGPYLSLAKLTFLQLYTEVINFKN